jgi:hypothetical protein
MTVWQTRTFQPFHLIPKSHPWVSFDKYFDDNEAIAVPAFYRFEESR